MAGEEHRGVLLYKVSIHPIVQEARRFVMSKGANVSASDCRVLEEAVMQQTLALLDADREFIHNIFRG